MCQVNDIKINHPASPAQAMALVDVEKPRDSAIFLRGACIFAGLALIQRFEWMLQMFGVLLLVAVFRILTEEATPPDLRPA
mgnify:CR=1 FL=1